MRSEHLTAGLVCERTDATSLVVASGEPILRLRADPSRVRVDLVLLGGARAVDVSCQPSAAAGVVRGRAARAGADPNGWSGALVAALRADATRWGLSVDATGDLCRALGALAHPVLAAAYREGASTLDDVPRWAACALAQPSVAAAAGAWFGPERATRPVVRALASALASLPASWWTLGLAVAAAPSLEADDLARCLASPAPLSTSAPTGEEVRAAAAALRLAGRARARALVLEAARSGEATALVATLRLLLDVQRDLPWPVPSSRADLHRVCLLAAAIDPDPAPGPRGLPAHPVRRAPSPPPPPAAAPRREAPSPRASGARPLPSITVARRAPEVRAPAPDGDAVLRHGELARSLARAPVAGGYDLVLPRTARELDDWGRLLDNCLGSFAAAVASGATTVVGVRHQGVLVAAFEVRARQLVQLLGARNRPVARALSEAVVGHVAAVLARHPAGLS